MKTIVSIVFIILAIFIFAYFIRVKSWEDLIENKKKEFTNKGLKKKQSATLKYLCTSLFVVAIGINFINPNYSMQKSNEMMMVMEDTYESCFEMVESEEEIYNSGFSSDSTYKLLVYK